MLEVVEQSMAKFTAANERAEQAGSGRYCSPLHGMPFFSLSVGLTGQLYLLEIEGLFTQGSRPGWTVGGRLVGFMKHTVLIGRTGFSTRSIPDPR